LELKDAELRKLKTEYIHLSDELCSLKKLSPEAAPVLADFTPFEDVSPTVTAPPQVCAFF